MSMLLEESAVMAKTKELCTAIVEQESFSKLQSQVEKFLSNDEARLQYQSVHEMGDALNQKQSSGVELADAEISEFESTREQLLKNDTITDFIAAQKELQKIQSSVTKFIGMTLELGRVPTQDDIEEANNAGGG